VAALGIALPGTRRMTAIQCVQCPPGIVKCDLCNFCCEGYATQR
jgi:hypothetical protein